MSRRSDSRCTRTSWTAAIDPVDRGSIDASSALLYGIGASLEATRRIGASSSSKAALGDPVGDPGAEAAVGPVLLDDHGAVGLGDRGQQRVEVERADGAQVDHLGVDLLLGASFSAAASVALSDRE